MGKRQGPSVDDLGDLFVAITGDVTVTEAQVDSTGDREVRDVWTVTIEDGLRDAVGDDPDVDADAV